jgi:hypothetical protein
MPNRSAFAGDKKQPMSKRLALDTHFRHKTKELSQGQLLFFHDRRHSVLDPLRKREACRRADDSTNCPFVGAFINPITISDDGRLFVATALPVFSDALYEIDPELLRAPRQSGLSGGSRGMHGDQGANVRQEVRPERAKEG